MSFTQQAEDTGKSFQVVRLRDYRANTELGGTCVPIQLALHNFSKIFVTLSALEGKYTHLV